MSTSISGVEDSQRRANSKTSLAANHLAFYQSTSFQPAITSSTPLVFPTPSSSVSIMINDSNGHIETNISRIEQRDEKLGPTPVAQDELLGDEKIGPNRST